MENSRSWLLSRPNRATRQKHCESRWDSRKRARSWQRSGKRTVSMPGYSPPALWAGRRSQIIEGWSVSARFEPEKGGKRKPYGGTLSLGIKRGTLVKHPTWGKAYVGGTMDGKLSLHDPETGKRLTQSANVADCRLIKLLRWKTRLAPLATARQGAPASSPAWKTRGIRRRRVV